MNEFDQYMNFFDFSASPEYMLTDKEICSLIKKMSHKKFADVFVYAFGQHKLYWEARGHKYE